MANIKTTINSQGVVSTQVAPGGSSILSVAIPVNLTAYSGSNLSTSSTGVQHLYVSDIHGSDLNSGTSAANPLKTMASAIAKIPSVVKHDVVIHVGAHGSTGYTWATINNCTLVDGASIHVIGDGAGQVGEDGFTERLSSTAALSNSTNAVVKNTGMVVDVYKGYTIEILTGAAAGDRRTIMENTATDIVPVMRFTEAIAVNDTYRIVSPAVRITLPAYYVASPTPPDINTQIICAGLGDMIDVATASPAAGENTHRSSLVLVNLGFDPVAGALLSWASVEFIGSLVHLIGVELSGGGLFASSGELSMGLTQYAEFWGANFAGYAVVDLPTLLTSKKAWLGWTLSQPSSTSNVWLSGGGHRHGVYVGSNLSLSDGSFNFYGGRLKVTSGYSPALFVSANRRGAPSCHLGSYSYDTTPTVFLGIKLQTVDTPCISVTKHGQLSCPNLGSAAPLILSSSTGTGIFVDLKGVCDISSGHNFPGGFSLTTGGWGVSVKRGGTMFVDHDMSAYVIAGLGAFTLDELTAYPAIAGAGVPGTIDNHYLVAQDGSAIISAD